MVLPGISWHGGVDCWNPEAESINHIGPRAPTTPPSSRRFRMPLQRSTRGKRVGIEVYTGRAALPGTANRLGRCAFHPPEICAPVYSLMPRKFPKSLFFLTNIGAMLTQIATGIIFHRFEIGMMAAKLPSTRSPSILFIMI